MLTKDPFCFPSPPPLFFVFGFFFFFILMSLVFDNTVSDHFKPACTDFCRTHARKNSEVCYSKLKVKILELATYHSPPPSWASLSNYLRLLGVKSNTVFKTFSLKSSNLTISPGTNLCNFRPVLSFLDKVPKNLEVNLARQGKPSPNPPRSHYIQELHQLTAS